MEDERADHLPLRGKVASERLTQLAYDELRRIARRYLARERTDHTLQPTALVHEAYLRLVGLNRFDWRGRTHFLEVAARQMRRVLVDHARARQYQKRGCSPHRITLSELHAKASPTSVEVLAVDEALDELARRSPRQSRVAEMRLFAGFRMAEIAG